MLTQSGGLSHTDLPGFWRDADATSLGGQRWTLRYSRARLGGSLVAAIGGVLSWHMGRVDLAGAVILAGFATALISEVVAAAHRPEREWYDGRAVAESVKTLAWRYAVGADPVPASMDRDDAQAVLRERMSKVADGMSDKITFRSADPVITDVMDELRALPFEDRRKVYLQGRTGEQHTWYAQKARENRRHSTIWRGILITAEVSALILAALRVFGGWDVDLAGLMGAVIASAAAWMSLKQYSPLASAYSVAAKELAIQGDKLKSVPQLEWALVVADAEEAISREHTMWLASRTGRKPM